MHWLDPVQAAIEEADAPVEMFFRDDDAGWEHPRLLRLFDLFEHTGLPLDLAVIPMALDRGLAAELRGRATVPGTRLGLHQHGLAHRNHEPEGRRYEFGPSRSPWQQRHDIRTGAARLAALLGDVAQPIFTPPWNRCTVDTGRCLVDLGFRVLSREWRAAPLGLAGLHELPIRVDWFAHRNGVRLPPPELGAQLGDAIREGGPVGLMLHHAVMSAADFRRAGDLLALLAGHPGVRAGPILHWAARRAPEPNGVPTCS
jgi:hypothetical protein